MPEKVGNVRAALSRHRPTNGAEPEIGNVTNLRTVVKSATTDTGTDADIQGRNTVFRIPLIRFIPFSVAPGPT